jgi:23S rRNA pseudouridine955/2504/2580 synthase
VPLFKWFDKASGKAKMFVNKEKWVEAKTSYICKKHFTDSILWPISLIEVQLFTWRMHQIRIHMAHIGYPILWDVTYGNAAINRIATKEKHIQRQLLHSRKYWFFDVFIDTWVSFEAQIPEIFTDLFMS